MGYGYIDVFPRTGETVGSARYAIEEIMRPLLVGQPIEEMNRLNRLINFRMMDNRRAKGGVDMALYDLLAKCYGAPLYVLLGGAGAQGDHGHQDGERGAADGDGAGVPRVGG